MWLHSWLPIFFPQWKMGQLSIMLPVRSHHQRKCKVLHVLGEGQRRYVAPKRKNKTGHQINSTLKNRRNFCKFSNFILGICKRKYEGGCSNYQTDGLLLQENTRTKGTFLAGNEDYFSVGECYDKCINYPGCHGFFVSKDNSRCALFKEGCQQRIDNYPYWDYYELSDDCEGIFAIF